jgi:hypothetical protein
MGPLDSSTADPADDPARFDPPPSSLTGTAAMRTMIPPPCQPALLRRANESEQLAGTHAATHSADSANGAFTDVGDSGTREYRPRRQQIQHATRTHQGIAYAAGRRICSAGGNGQQPQRRRTANRRGFSFKQVCRQAQHGTSTPHDSTRFSPVHAALDSRGIADLYAPSSSPAARLRIPPLSMRTSLPRAAPRRLPRSGPALTPHFTGQPVEPPGRQAQ